MRVCACFPCFVFDPPVSSPFPFPFQALKALTTSLSVSDGLKVRTNVSHYLSVGVCKVLCDLVSGNVQGDGGGEGVRIKNEWILKVRIAAVGATSLLVGEGGEMAAEAAIDRGIIGRVGEIVMEQSSIINGLRGIAGATSKATPSESLVDACCILLANISRSEAGCSSLLDKSSLLEKLIDEFAKGYDKSFDAYQHVSTILMNVSQVERGRKLILKLSSGVLKRISPFLTDSNQVRRYGVAGAIRNVCFEKDSSWWLVNEAKIVDTVCYPLCGPEGFELDDKKGMNPEMWLEGADKVREPDAKVRKLLVESILLLCATGRRTREKLRSMQVYTIIKVLDLSEDDESVSEKIDECVQFLMRDEEGCERIEGEESSEVTTVVADVTGVIKSSSSDNYDNVD